MKTNARAVANMTIEQALRRLGYLRGILSAIKGLIEAARTVQADDPALIAAIYDADDAATLAGLRGKTLAAIATIMSMPIE